MIQSHYEKNWLIATIKSIQKQSPPFDLEPMMIPPDKLSPEQTEHKTIRTTQTNLLWIRLDDRWHCNESIGRCEEVKHDQQSKNVSSLY